MTSYTFETILLRPEGVGTWTYLNLPADVSASFGVQGQVRVKGTINGLPFRSTALPSGSGSHYLVVGKEIRAQINVKQGDSVKVTLEQDLDERILDIPEDLQSALDSQPQAQMAFEKMSYSHQKEYLDWINEAKKTATRQNRIEKTVLNVLTGKNIRQVH